MTSYREQQDRVYYLAHVQPLAPELLELAEAYYRIGGVGKLVDALVPRDQEIGQFMGALFTDQQQRRMGWLLEHRLKEVTGRVWLVEAVLEFDKTVRFHINEAPGVMYSRAVSL